MLLELTRRTRTIVVEQPATYTAARGQVVAVYTNDASTTASSNNLFNESIYGEIEALRRSVSELMLLPNTLYLL